MAEERKTTYLDLFIEVTKAITSSLDLDEVFELITQWVDLAIRGIFQQNLCRNIKRRSMLFCCFVWPLSIRA